MYPFFLYDLCYHILEYRSPMKFPLLLRMMAVNYIVQWCQNLV